MNCLAGNPVVQLPLSSASRPDLTHSVWTDSPPGWGADPTPCPGHPRGLWASPHELWLLDLDAFECALHLWVNSDSVLRVPSGGRPGPGALRSGVSRLHQQISLLRATRCPGVLPCMYSPLFSSETGILVMTPEARPASHTGHQSRWAGQGPTTAASPVLWSIEWGHSGFEGHTRVTMPRDSEGLCGSLSVLSVKWAKSSRLRLRLLDSRAEARSSESVPLRAARPPQTCIPSPGGFR